MGVNLLRLQEVANETPKWVVAETPHTKPPLPPLFAAWTAVPEPSLSAA
jgi:hypothetical protein